MLFIIHLQKKRVGKTVSYEPLKRWMKQKAFQRTRESLLSVKDLAKDYSQRVMNKLKEETNRIISLKISNK